MRRRPLPPASFEPTGRHRDRWATPLEAAAKALQRAFDAASLAGRELEAVTAELRLALKDYNPLFVGVASWLAGTYHATGRDDRAEAVRPSRWRQGLRLQDASRAVAAPTVATEGTAEKEPEAATVTEGGKRAPHRFAPLRQALRRLGGRSSDEEPPRSAGAGGR